MRNCFTHPAMSETTAACGPTAAADGAGAGSAMATAAGARMA